MIKIIDKISIIIFVELTFLFFANAKIINIKHKIKIATEIMKMLTDSNVRGELTQAKAMLGNSQPIKLKPNAF